MKGASMQIKSRMMLAVLSICILEGIIACGKEGSEGELLLQNAVRKYNSTLAEAYRERSVEPLMGAATEKEIERVELLIRMLEQKGLFLDGQLRRIDFGRAEMEAEDRGRISTEEVWDYRHLDVKTKGIISKRKITYRLIYHLVKDKDGWLVDRVNLRD